MENRVELLSPAGDMECLQYALAHGADAVYLGAKEFGMRAASANFSAEELALAVQLAHGMGRKVYLTLNALPTNDEVLRLPDTICAAQEAGVDALIVADLGVLQMAKKYAPATEVHFSTQVGITNYAAANAAYDMGVKRVILARELSIDDIATIRQNTPEDLQLEVFVHGAMCMSFSGRCLLSAVMNGRDANRGKCTQPCRWRYSLMEETRPGQYFEVGETVDGSYILSADDLCAAPFLDRLVQAGVSSLKIEGRAKSFYYAASVTSAYRVALDAALSAPCGTYTMPQFTEQELTRVSHRPYSPGFFFGRQGATQSPQQEGYIREWQPVAEVLRQEDGRIYCRQRGKFTLGETLEALVPGGGAIAFTPMEILNEAGEAVEATPHTKMLFSLQALQDVQLPQYTILRRPL